MFFHLKMINNNSNAFFNSNSFAGFDSRCLNWTKSRCSEMLYSMHSLSLHVNQLCLLLKRSCHVDSCRNNTVLLKFNNRIGDRRFYLKSGSWLDRNWLIYVVSMYRACQLCRGMFPQIVVALRKDISLSRVAPVIFLSFKCLPLVSEHCVVLDRYAWDWRQRRSLFVTLGLDPDLCLRGAWLCMCHLAVFGLVWITSTACESDRFSGHFSWWLNWLHE